jgi:hypothetical protein
MQDDYLYHYGTEQESFHVENLQKIAGLNARRIGIRRR